MKFHKSQQGTVLVITLLLLIVMTLIVLSGSRNTTLQLRMASNLQARFEAVQKTQAAIDHVIDNYKPTDFSNTDLHVCTENHTSDTCETFKGGDHAGEWIELGSLNLDTSSAAGTSWVEIKKIREDIEIPASASETTSIGQPVARNYKGTGFEITSGYDGTGTGQGKVITKVGVLTFSN